MVQVTDLSEIILRNNYKTLKKEKEIIIVSQLPFIECLKCIRHANYFYHHLHGVSQMPCGVDTSVLISQLSLMNYLRLDNQVT